MSPFLALLTRDMRLAIRVGGGALGPALKSVDFIAHKLAGAAARGQTVYVVLLAFFSNHQIV